MQLRARHYVKYSFSWLTGLFRVTGDNKPAGWEEAGGVATFTADVSYEQHLRVIN